MPHSSTLDIGSLDSAENNGDDKSKELVLILSAENRIPSKSQLALKGQQLVEAMFENSVDRSAMKGPSLAAPKATFTDEDFAKWGYIKVIYPSRRCQAVDKFKTMFTDLEVTGECLPILHQHLLDTTVGETDYKATSAHFDQIINLDSGVMIAHKNMNPANAYKKVDLLPDLKHWSDVAVLQWMHVVNKRRDRNINVSKRGLSIIGNMKTPDYPLRYVIRSRIQNDVTLSVIQWLVSGNYEYNAKLDSHAKTLICSNSIPTWPGITYDINSNEGKLLLATPNGAGVAMLLIQNRAQLGHKVVEKITLFCDDATELFSCRFPSLCFHLKYTGRSSPENSC